MTPRKLMWTYAKKLVTQIHQLKFVASLDNIHLKVIMGELVNKHGYQFTFGNAALAKSLTYWVSREKAREHSKIVPDDIQTMEEELRAREEKRLRAQLAKNEEEDAEYEVVKEDDEVGMDDEQPGPSKSLTFTTFPHVEMECNMGGMKFTLPPGTPCKLTPKKKKVYRWSDKMKVQLLILWIEKANNPLKRPKPTEGARSRAVYRRDPNMEDLYENSTITTDDGRQVALSSLCKPDYVHNCLASGQLTNQSSLGLVKLIDEVMAGEERTKEKLAEKKGEIIALANSLCKEDSESD